MITREKIGGLARLLGNEVNLKILAVLSLGDNYPREISSLINVDETDISRRLRRLEKAGLVSSYWGRIGGKNVKLYKLAVRNISFKFELGRLKIDLPIGASEEAVITPLASIPTQLFLIGRDRELGKLSSSTKPVIHVWGPPGIGKTSLVSYFLRTRAPDKPVYWHFSSSRDNFHEFIIKIGSFLSYLGFRELLKVNKSDRETISTVLSEGLRRTGLILVIDDYHILPRDIRGFLNRLMGNYELERAIIISRFREESLPYWKGLIEEVRLGPLSKGQTLELIKRLSPPDMELSEDDIDLIWRLSRGIPIVVYSILNNLTAGGNVGDVGKSVLESYYSGALSEYLDRDYRVMLELLGVWRDWIRVDYACRALDYSESSCEWRMMKLASAGLVERRGDYVRIREYLHNIVNGLTDLRRKYYTLILSRVLTRSSLYEDKINGLELLAKECLVEEAAGFIRDRLMKGSSIFLCCPEKYVLVLEKLLKCNTPIREEPYIKAELAIVKQGYIMGDLTSVLETIKSILPKLRHDQPVYTRLLFLKASFESSTGRIEDSFETFKTALNLYTSLPVEAKKHLEETMASTGAAVYFNMMDVEKALEYSRKEADLALRSGDLANYLVSLMHIAEIYRLNGEFDRSISTMREVKEYMEKYSLPEGLKNILVIPELFSLIGIGDYEAAIEKALNPLVRGEASAYRDLMIIASLVALCLSKDYERAREVIDEYPIKICGEPNPGFVDDCYLYHLVRRILSRREPPAEVPEKGYRGDIIIANRILGECLAR